VMLVGGVGITPCMSMLRTFADRGDPRPLVLIYANEDLDAVIFHDEIEALRSSLDLEVVHVLEEPPEEWEGEEGLVDRDLLARHLPRGSRVYDHFVCGPKPMMDAVEKALLALDVPQHRILSERFNMV
jgi:ferredoxin-NADP reductase